MSEPFYPGKTIAIRLPKDTPPEVLDRLDELKRTEGRGFSRAITDHLFHSILTETTMRDNAYLPLPGPLTFEEKEMLNTPMQRRVLGHFVYHLIKEDIPLQLPKEKQEESAPSTFQTSTVHNKFASNLFNMDDD